MIIIVEDAFVIIISNAFAATTVNKAITMITFNIITRVIAIVRIDNIMWLKKKKSLY